MIRFRLHKQLQGAAGAMFLQMETALQSGSLTGISGPSGAGKTTLLRLLAGLEQADEGEIFFKETPWFRSSDKFTLPAARRGVGFVFQQPAVFPHMSVAKHFAFALPESGAKEEATAMMSQTGLANFAAQNASRLSGGQKQRLALGMALLRKPALLLLDEPFAALDAVAKYELQQFILSAHQASGLTTLLVSHDFADLQRMSDNILLVEDGKIKGSVSGGNKLPNPAGSITELSGRIVGMQKTPEGCTLQVSVGAEVISMHLSLQESQAFSAGDLVKVKVELNGISSIVQNPPLFNN